MSLDGCDFQSEKKSKESSCKEKAHPQKEKEEKQIEEEEESGKEIFKNNSERIQVSKV